jgi:hypothetical protein
MCPKCKVGISYGIDIINKKDLKCPNCQHIFSYDDGFIESLANKAIDVLLILPIYIGVDLSGPFKTRVGKATKVRFENPLYEVYDITFGTLVGITDEKLFEQIEFKAIDINKEGFIAISSSFNDSIINQKIDVAYIVRGRDFLENVPIWHRFLQDAINSINSNRYGMAIVESISAFDAFFDEFLMNQLVNKRGYPIDYVKRIVRNYQRRDKIFYFLFCVTGRSFENSPYNKNLADIAELRNKIVHPKEYEFKEKELTEDKAKEVLQTVIKSIKWINDTKS